MFSHRETSERDVGSALMSLNSFISHRPSTKAYPRRQLNLWLSRASEYRRATEECDGSTPGHYGSGNAALALSRRRCRAAPYTSSVTPRFSNMLLSPPLFRVRSVVRLGVICLALRSPVVTISAVRDMVHVGPSHGSSVPWRLSDAPEQRVSLAVLRS